MTRARGWILASWLVMATLPGCSVITANNREMLDARAGMVRGQWADALAAVDPTRRDDLCAMLDRAVILQDQGRFTDSNTEFDRAIQKVRDFENRATVSATEVAAGAGSLVLNDKTFEYQGEGYEKVLIHALKARNYLMLGDESAARVEIRNANMRQDEERERHKADIDKAQEEARKNRVNLRRVSDDIDKQFASSASILSRLDNVYQNPFATYLSAVVYELNGESGEALVDLKKAYRLTPNPLIASELTRLARSLHRQDELEGLGISADAGGPPHAGGNTLIFVDNGLAPARDEIKFPIPTGDTLLFAALPITRPVPTSLSEVEVVDSRSGEVLGRTQVLVDIEAMSVRDLRDRYPMILVRQAIRLAGRGVAAHAAQKQAKGQDAELVTLVVSSIFNAVVEQADLRAWYALPRSMHVARVNLPAGHAEVRLRFLDLAGRAMDEQLIPIAAVSRHLNVASVRYINGRVTIATPANTSGTTARSNP